MNSSKGKILLVDDDIDLLRLLTIRLTAADFELATAENGKDALKQLSIFRPHLVITDLRMDGMDGLALFDAIHHSNPRLPTIILTAHGTIPDAITAINRGVFSFLTKPFDGKDLLAQITRALDLTYAPISEKEKMDLSWRREIITRSALMEDLLNQGRLVADSDLSILIRGESGTGKELLAKAIHLASGRRQKPFVAINCGAIPEPLLESELFGYSKGAFTGAVQSYEGLFRAAHEGTLFLDEIGDMPLALQVKLLRVLQEKQVRQIGSAKSIPIDVRIICATHRNVDLEIKNGNFRPDLYYRLNGFSLELPNLEKRREDIPLLAMHFLENSSKKNKKDVTGFSPDAMELLIRASWPGNVRQLSNVVEQAVVISSTPVISANLIQTALREKPRSVLSLKEAKNYFEQTYLIELLRLTRGNVSQAARLAQRNRTEFYKLLQRHALDPTTFKNN